MTVDSGACDTVIPTEMCAHIPVAEGSRRKDNLEYEVANGETIKNEGERHCLLMTMGANTPKKIVFQVAGIHKALLSSSRSADAGFDTYLGLHGGNLIDTVTGELVPIIRRGNLYVMRCWIKADPGFPRQE